MNFRRGVFCMPLNENIFKYEEIFPHTYEFILKNYIIRATLPIFFLLSAGTFLAFKTWGAQYSPRLLLREYSPRPTLPIPLTFSEELKGSLHYHSISHDCGRD